MEFRNYVSQSQLNEPQYHPMRRTLRVSLLEVRTVKRDLASCYNAAWNYASKQRYVIPQLHFRWNLTTHYELANARTLELKQEAESIQQCKRFMFE